MDQTEPLDAARAPHCRRVDRIIRDRVADAVAHARRGDVITAAQRLQDLRHALLGPAGQGAVGDARAAFYRDCWRIAPFDPEIHDPALLHPVAEGADAARTAPINGRDASRDLALLIDQARRHLGVAATSGDPESRAAAIDTWRSQHEPRLRSWAAREISDSQIAIHNVVSFLRLRPEHRDGEQHPVGSG